MQHQTLENYNWKVFINKSFRIPFNKWLQAEFHPTKGFKLRPYWHCTSKPNAPHLSTKDRVWVKVEIDDYKEFQRPNNQGGLWFLVNKIKFNEC